ncbi:MAG: hypothetical protein AAF466_01785 [Bacteroidota bacterium]
MNKQPMTHLKKRRYWMILSSALLLTLTLSLIGCGEKKEEEKKECEVVVLDWPKEIKDCITAAEERGLRDGSKSPADVWKDMNARCPKVKNVDNGYLLYSLKAFPDALTVGTKEEVAQKVKAHAEANDCCIKKITFAGHGRPGKISTGDGQVTRKCKYVNGKPGNKADWQKDLAPLKDLLCDDAKFHLRGCSVGYCSIGTWKMEEIAIFFDVTVVAPTINVTGDTKLDDLPADKKRTVKPPIPNRTVPLDKCDTDFDKIKEKERKDASSPGFELPFTEPIQSIGFYPGTFEGEYPDILENPPLPITDPEWIDQFTQLVNGEIAYNATNESYEKDAVIVIQYESGAYDYAYTTYGNMMYGHITAEGVDLEYTFLEPAAAMIAQGIQMSLGSR